MNTDLRRSSSSGSFSSLGALGEDESAPAGQSEVMASAFSFFDPILTPAQVDHADQAVKDFIKALENVGDLKGCAEVMAYIQRCFFEIGSVQDLAKAIVSRETESKERYEPDSLTRQTEAKKEDRVTPLRSASNEVKSFFTEKKIEQILSTDGFKLICKNVAQRLDEVNGNAPLLEALSLADDQLLKLKGRKDETDRSIKEGFVRSNQNSVYSYVLTGKAKDPVPVTDEVKKRVGGVIRAICNGIQQFFKGLLADKGSSESKEIESASARTGNQVATTFLALMNKESGRASSPAPSRG